MCIAAIAAAQQKADIEVGYTAHHPNMRNGKDDMTNQYILLANAEESKFYSPKTEYIDSLTSTPDGMAKYNEMTRTAYLGGKMEDMPRRDGSYYVVKSCRDNKFVYYDNGGLEKSRYEEDIPEWGWEMADSAKTVLGYECIAAVTELHGRKWTVWFTPEIPVSAGPWKLEGLPGLILDAEAEGGQYRFVADGVQRSDKDISPVYMADEYEKTDRLSYLRAKRSFLENPMGQINAKFAGKISVKSADGSAERMFVPASVADLIETDYH